MKHDASRILMSPLILGGTLNCPYVLTKSPAGFNDENSRFPFSNWENGIDKIELVEFTSFW
jgi:hypothetical protein